MDSYVKYKNNKIKFYDLIDKGRNLDGYIINGNLYSRKDHNFNRLLKLIDPGSVVYDIGAYIGTFSIPFAIEGMKVYSFEGFPDNHKKLKKNCEAYSNIETHLIAVSNKKHKVFTKFNDCTSKTPKKRRIEYVIFDEYIKKNNIEKPDLVKVDIEGMETLALFGMTHILEDIKPIWQIGYHWGLDVKFDGYPGFVKVEDGGFNFNRFFELGYNVYNEGEKVSEFSKWGEYLCVHETSERSM